MAFRLRRAVFSCKIDVFAGNTFWSKFGLTQHVKKTTKKQNKNWHVLCRGRKWRLHFGLGWNRTFRHWRPRCPRSARRQCRPEWDPVPPRPPSGSLSVRPRPENEYNLVYFVPPTVVIKEKIVIFMIALHWVLFWTLNLISSYVRMSWIHRWLGGGGDSNSRGVPSSECMYHLILSDLTLFSVTSTPSTGKSWDPWAEAAEVGSAAESPLAIVIIFFVVGRFCAQYYKLEEFARWLKFFKKFQRQLQFWTKSAVCHCFSPLKS